MQTYNTTITITITITCFNGLKGLQYSKINRQSYKQILLLAETCKGLTKGFSILQNTVNKFRHQAQSSGCSLFFVFFLFLLLPSSCPCFFVDDVVDPLVRPLQRSSSEVGSVPSNGIYKSNIAPFVAVCMWQAAELSIQDFYDQGEKFFCQQNVS